MGLNDTDMKAERLKIKPGSTKNNPELQLRAIVLSSFSQSDKCAGFLDCLSLVIFEDSDYLSYQAARAVLLGNE